MNLVERCVGVALALVGTLAVASGSAVAEETCVASDPIEKTVTEPGLTINHDPEPTKFDSDPYSVHVIVGSASACASADDPHHVCASAVRPDVHVDTYGGHTFVRTFLGVQEFSPPPTSNDVDGGPAVDACVNS